jgi:hypothetical protein
MKRTKLNIGRQVFWTKDFVGLLWICTGITGMLGTKTGNILHYVLLACTLLLAIVLSLFEWEKDDEMSQYNYMKAKAQTTRVMHFVYCIAMVIMALIIGLIQKAGNDVNPAIARVFFVIMGIQSMITGIVFRKLEAE